MEYPIRVLNLFCSLDRGGAETAVMNIYRNIDRTKVQFDFLVHNEEPGAYSEEIQRLGGQIYRMPRIRLKTLFQYKKELRKFYTAHPEYQIVHSHISELGCIALHEAAKAKIPIRICHAHSAPKEFSLKTPIRYAFKKYTLLWTNERLACGIAAGKWQYGKQEYRIIPNGIDIKKFAFASIIREQYRKQFGFLDEIVIGHVGRFEKPKNHYFLIIVFKALIEIMPNTRLVLVGDGSMKKEIENMVHSLGIDSHVLFLGVRDDVECLYQIFDVFLFPSLHEGLPVSCIEAQASGLPCVFSDRFDPNTVVTDRCRILSLSEPPEKWAQTILEVSALPRVDTTEQVRKAGYDIQETSKYMEAFYCSKGNH